MPVKVEDPEVPRKEDHGTIKKEVLHYDHLAKYGWEQEGDIVR
jgi:hypothetical protein